MVKSSRSGYFPTIDVLRAFASLSVLVYHIIEYWSWTAFPGSGPLSWFRIGWMGVDHFFVISGFVIALSAFSGIDNHGVSGFRWSFFRKRLLRIVPLHYLTMLIFIAFVIPELLFHNFWVNLVAHLFFVHNFFLRLHGSINGSNWSLATEMQFYLLICVIAPWLRTGRVWKIALIFISVTWAWRYGVILFVSPTTSLGSFPIFIAATQLPGMLDEFAVGILIARFVRSDVGTRVLSYLNNGTGWFAFPVAGLAVYLALSLFWKYPGFWDHPWMVVCFRTLLALSFGVVVLAACAVNPTGARLWLLRPFLYLGTISYGIYLWQLPVILCLKRVEGLAPEQALLIAACITIVLAAGSWHFFESPFIQRFSESAGASGIGIKGRTSG